MTSIRRPRALACIALLVLLGFSLGFSEFTVIGIEPELAEAFDVPLARVGELISFFSVAYAVLTPLLAVSTGRFKRFTLLIVYVALFCVSNIMMTFAPTFEVLLAARILLGAVSGALLAVGVTFIPELVGVHRMSMMISVVYAAFSVAMVVATSVGKIVAEVLNWHAVMIIALVLALAVSAAMLAVLPRHGSTDEPSTVREQAGLLTEPQILVGIAIFLFGVGSVYVFYGYITPYLEDVLGMDAVGASMTLMVYGVMCFISNLISGWVDLKYGMKALLVVFPVQALFLVALFLVSPGDAVVSGAGHAGGPVDVCGLGLLHLAVHARGARTPSEGDGAGQLAGADGVQHRHRLRHGHRRCRGLRPGTAVRRSGRGAVLIGGGRIRAADAAHRSTSAPPCLTPYIYACAGASDRHRHTISRSQSLRCAMA